MFSLIQQKKVWKRPFIWFWIGYKKRLDFQPFSFDYRNLSFLLIFRSVNEFLCKAIFAVLPYDEVNTCFVACQGNIQSIVGSSFNNLITQQIMDFNGSGIAARFNLNQQSFIDNF
jgi:hypothetical protein